MVVVSSQNQVASVPGSVRQRAQYQTSCSAWTVAVYQVKEVAEPPGITERSVMRRPGVDPSTANQ